MAGRLVEFAGWLATQVFDVVGSVAGVQDADGGSAVDLQVGKTVFHDVPRQVRGMAGSRYRWHRGYDACGVACHMAVSTAASGKVRAVSMP
jgi:hypothetical protein